MRSRTTVSIEAATSFLAYRARAVETTPRSILIHVSGIETDYGVRF
ncbi:MAG: hypothetical protein IH951_11100 [Bacteroidetes bacterium]|nr:hypothetical protein [Bacteroidota bacterium]